MPATWPTQALRAQAIAARSYAIAALHPDTGTFDLYDDTRSQVYRGIEAEQAATDALIAAEPGRRHPRRRHDRQRLLLLDRRRRHGEQRVRVRGLERARPGRRRSPTCAAITDRNASGDPVRRGRPVLRLGHEHAHAATS